MHVHNNGSFANPYTASQPGMYMSGDHATLFLFQPNRAHPLGVQAHRPLLYHFDETFASRIYDVTEATRMSTGASHKDLVRQVLTSPQARASIVPSAEPDAYMNFAGLNDYWRFVLILNQPKAPNFGGASMFSNLTKHRVIITGFCLDDPLSPYTQALNPNAPLMVTHKTVFEMSSVQNPMGVSSTNLSARYDANVVNHGTTQFSSDPGLFYTDPASAYDGTYDTGDGMTLAYPGAQQKVGYQQQNKPIQTALENPTAHLRQLVGRVVATKREVTDAPHLASLYGDSHIQLPQQGLENFRDVFSRNLSRHDNAASLLGPNENEVITLGSIDAQYNPVVTPIYSDQTGMFGVSDQMALSARNIYSSMLAAAIPTILVSQAMARLDFKFTSNYRNDDPLTPYYLEIYTSVPAYPMDSQSQTRRVQTIIDELYRTVFRSLYEARREFTVSISVDMGGLTHINLHFFDDTERFLEPYEHPTVVGGMLTPLMGNSRILSHNSSELTALVDSLTVNDSSFMGGGGNLGYQGPGGNSHGSGFPTLMEDGLDL